MAKYQDTVETLITARNTAVEELRKAEAVMREQARAERQRQIEQAAFAKQLADTNAEITEQQLRSQGKNLEADIQQIRRYYNARIDAAQKANQQELADRLLVLGRLKEAQARTASEQAGDGGEGDPVLRRFQGLAGITMAGRTLEGLTRGAIEARDEIARLGATGEEAMTIIAKRTMEAIPIVGNFFKAGQNLRELFTGEVAAIERITAATKDMNKALEQVIANRFKERDVSRFVSDREQELQNKIALARANPEDREALLLRQSQYKTAEEFKREIENIRTKADADLGELAKTDEYKKLIKLEDELKEREKQKAFAPGFFKEGSAAAKGLNRLRSDVTNQKFIVDGMRKSIDLDLEKAASLEKLRPLYSENAKLEREALAARQKEQAQRKQEEEEKLGQARAAKALEDFYAPIEGDYAARQRKAEEDRKAEIESIRERARGIDEESRSTRDRISLLRRGVDAPGAMVADQSRFAAGLRQVVQAQDRAAFDQANKQIAALEKQLAESQAMRKTLDDMLRKLQQAPIVITGGTL